MISRNQAERKGTTLQSEQREIRIPKLPRQFASRLKLFPAQVSPFKFQRGTLLMMGNLLVTGLLATSLLTLYAQASLSFQTGQESQVIQASPSIPAPSLTASLSPTEVAPNYSKTEDEEEAELLNNPIPVETESPSKSGGVMKSPIKKLTKTLTHGVTRLLMPVKNAYISSRFGPRHGRLHAGTDLAAPLGETIVASAPGRVTFSGWESGYGNLVVVDHGNGMKTRYAHCSRLLVGVGRQVNSGEAIAKVGDTGHSTGPHLHFEVIAGGVAQNPEKYLALR